MTITRVNALIAAGLAFVNSVFPFLIIIGVLHLTTDGLAALYLVVSNFATLVGLLLSATPITNTPAP